MKKFIIPVILSVVLIFGMVAIKSSAASSGCVHPTKVLMERTLMSTTYEPCNIHSYCYIGTNHYYCRYMCNSCGTYLYENVDEEFHTYPH